jgi:hypothetical protein
MTPNDIFDLIDPVVAMQKYFPGVVSTSMKYRNPFRIDKNPTCFFGWSKSGRFVFYDPARPDCSGDAIKILMLSQNLSFGEAMEKINEDFNLGLSTKKIINRTELTPMRKQKKREFEAKVKKTYFQIHLRNWNKKDQEYWLQFGIDIKLLKKYNIFPVKKYYTKTKSTSGFLLVYNYDRDRNDPCYCYRIGEDDPNVKLYRPLAKDVANKWRTNTTVNDVQGLDQLPLYPTNDTLIITSSMKDVLTLVSIGYDAIAPQSEGVCVPINIINKLKKKYKRIIFIYDSDETGHKFSKQHAELSNCEYRLLSKHNDQKDFADIRSVINEEEFIQYVNKTIDDNNRCI